MIRLTILSLSILFTTPLYAQIPTAATGTIRRLDHFPSTFVEARNVDIWLPDGYNPQLQYNVLYMHDGQMLYDSTTTWNHKTWDADDVMGKLIRTERIQNTIIVGVWNAGASRHRNYFPQKPFESMSRKQQQFVNKQLQQAGRTKEVFQPDSDNYLKFLVYELKPVIDSMFAVYKDRQHTFIAGSSMGGLISMYAICEYPDVFGGAACMSTHWPGIFTVDKNPVPDAFFQYLKITLPDPATHKLYFDYGDQTLDALYPPLQKQADEIIKARGYDSNQWKTQFFPGDSHTEDAWHGRLEVPLYFLLRKE